MPKKQLTEKGVEKLAPTPGKQIDYRDAGQRGLILRVSWGGSKAWRVLYYSDKRTRSHGLGTYPQMGVKAARTAAARFLADLPTFLEEQNRPAPAPKQTFKQIADDYIKRVVEANGLRSKRQIQAILDTCILPEWSERAFVEVRRGDVTALLDKVADTRGPRMADMVLAIVRQITHWHQARVEDYTSPVVKGMNRTKPSERRRSRILNDAEIAALWRACERLGTFGALTRCLLLTAQRRTKVSTMKRADVKDGVWSIPSERREKGTAGELKLPKLALAIIDAQPEIPDNPYIFTAGRDGRRDGPGSDFGSYSAFGQGKRDLDKIMREAISDMKPWVLHDLRRTARSLMSRADVRPDIAERTLGHAIGGVAEVYDRHDYREQKADALERLAALVARLVDPTPSGNVISLVGR